MHCYLSMFFLVAIPLRNFITLEKGTAFDMFANSSKLPFFVQTFMSPTSTRQDIEKKW